MCFWPHRWLTCGPHNNRRNSGRFEFSDTIIFRDLSSIPIFTFSKPVMTFKKKPSRYFVWTRCFHSKMAKHYFLFCRKKKAESWKYLWQFLNLPYGATLPSALRLVPDPPRLSKEQFSPRGHLEDIGNVTYQLRGQEQLTQSQLATS